MMTNGIGLGCIGAFMIAFGGFLLSSSDFGSRVTGSGALFIGVVFCIFSVALIVISVGEDINRDTKKKIDDLIP